MHSATHLASGLASGLPGGEAFEDPYVVVKWNDRLVGKSQPARSGDAAAAAGAAGGLGEKVHWDFACMVPLGAGGGVGRRNGSHALHISIYGKKAGLKRSGSGRSGRPPPSHSWLHRWRTVAQNLAQEINGASVAGE